MRISLATQEVTFYGHQDNWTRYTFEFALRAGYLTLERIKEYKEDMRWNAYWLGKYNGCKWEWLSGDAKSFLAIENRQPTDSPTNKEE